MAKFVQLYQSTGRPEDIKTLLPGWDGFWTGQMGNCVTTVVVWGLNTSNWTYAHARGIHGSGGFAANRFDDLLGDSPDDSGTLVIAVGGTLHTAGDGDAERIETAVRGNVGNALSQGRVLQMFSASSALINSKGLVKLNPGSAKGSLLVPGTGEIAYDFEWDTQPLGHSKSKEAKSCCVIM